MNQKKAKQIRKFVKKEYDNGQRVKVDYVSTEFTKYYLNEVKKPVKYTVVTTELVPQCLRAIYKKFKKEMSI